jgi:uncharacterized protein YndB with AHSA1/START domain
MDLRPGGIFRTVTRSPDGQELPNVGCFLEVVPKRRLVFTNARLPGYRPAETPFFTAIVTIEPDGKGTRYRTLALHKDEAGRKRHEEMGFRDGWAKALDRLVAYAKGM